MKCFAFAVAFLATMLGFHAVRACDNCGVGTGGPIAPTGPGFGLAPSYGCYGGSQQAFQQHTITTYSAPMVVQQAPIQYVPVQRAPMVGYGSCGVGRGVGFAPGVGCGVGNGVGFAPVPTPYGASAGPLGASAGYMGVGAGAGFGAAPVGFVGGGRVKSRAVTRTGIFGRTVSRARFRSR